MGEGKIPTQICCRLAVAKRLCGGLTQSYHLLGATFAQHIRNIFSFEHNFEINVWLDL